MIEIRALTKRYGRTTAVSDLTFTVRPGMVTGFLGPNGAGKSTTMRMILGLDEPTSGSVTVNGRPPRAHAAPLRELGGMLDPRAVHPSRSAYHHLLALAQTSGIRRSRVDEVIDAVGLRAVAGRRAGKFSLGMGQRLGIAAALLGDPATVVLDEPVNGLDVEGIRWIRALLQDLAAAGEDGLRLLAPDERDRADRHAPDRHRPGPPDRGHQRGGVHRLGRAPGRAGPQLGPGHAGRAAPLARRDRHPRRRRRAGRVRPARRRRSARSPPPPGSPCSSSPPSRRRWKTPSLT